jgi:hypothetical protein
MTGAAVFQLDYARRANTDVRNQLLSRWREVSPLAPAAVQANQNCTVPCQHILGDCSRQYASQRYWTGSFVSWLDVVVVDQDD